MSKERLTDNDNPTNLERFVVVVLTSVIVASILSFVAMVMGIIQYYMTGGAP